MNQEIESEAFFVLQKDFKTIQVKRSPPFFNFFFTDKLRIETQRK